MRGRRRGDARWSRRAGLSSGHHTGTAPVARSRRRVISIMSPDLRCHRSRARYTSPKCRSRSTRTRVISMVAHAGGSSVLSKRLSCWGGLPREQAADCFPADPRFFVQSRQFPDRGDDALARASCGTDGFHQRPVAVLVSVHVLGMSPQVHARSCALSMRHPQEAFLHYTRFLEYHRGGSGIDAVRLSDQPSF